MRKWANFGAFHGCEASYVQIPLLHTTKRTALHDYTSGYTEAIAQWAISVSPKLQLADLKKRLSNTKRKNFLAYHHFDPCLFEQLKKWGSMKIYSNKYRYEQQNLFGQDLFSHYSKRCCGLHTEECYLLPSDTKFEQVIEGAIEERSKKEIAKFNLAEMDTSSEQDTNLHPSDTNFEQVIEEAIEERSKKEIETTRPTMRQNGTDQEMTGKFNFVGIDTSSEQDTNRAQENKDTGEIMDVVAKLIWLSKQKKEETDYTIKKGDKISKNLVNVSVRKELHIARKVLGKERWYLGTKRVLIQWQSNSNCEWINESQIKGLVNQVNEKKRVRKTVQEAKDELTKRLKQEHHVSLTYKKRQKLLQQKYQLGTSKKRQQKEEVGEKGELPTVEKDVKDAVEKYGTAAGSGAETWHLFAGHIVDLTDKTNCLSELYQFVRQTSGVWQTVANIVRAKAEKVKRYK
jgi:hypothetical protein